MINFIEILIRCCEKQEKKLEIESNYGSFKTLAPNYNSSMGVFHPTTKESYKADFRHTKYQSKSALLAI